MVHSACRIGLAVLLLGLLSLAGLSGGQKEQKDEKIRAVKDDAGFFSKELPEQANKVIAKIKEKHHKDLCIETLEKGPARDEAAKWARDRFNDTGVDGIYIIISKDPKHFEVVLGNKTKAIGLFSQNNVDALVKILKENLGKNMDETLAKVVAYTQEAMDASGKAVAARPVQDDAGFFSKDALEQANKVIAQIKEKHRKDLWIETIERGKDKAEAAQSARERLEKSGLDGIYIVISKEPKHLEIVVGDKAKTYFTPDNVTEARKILTGNLGKNRDAALTKVVNYTQEAIDENHKAKEP